MYIFNRDRHHHTIGPNARHNESIYSAPSDLFAAAKSTTKTASDYWDLDDEVMLAELNQDGVTGLLMLSFTIFFAFEFDFFYWDEYGVILAIQTSNYKNLLIWQPAATFAFHFT